MTPPAAPAVPAGPPVTAIFSCRLSAEFVVTPPHALVTVDGTSIGQADNGDHTRADKKVVFARPGRHSVKLSAPGFRTTWIAVIVDPRAEEETAEIDTRLPPR